jgi:hypothetical protein
MRNDEIQDLIAQLNRLQVQHTELLVRLGRAADNKVALNEDLGNEAQEPKEFAIGDKVTITNPNLFQVNQGTITKVGQKRVTVTSSSGQKILRASKNLEIRR